MSDKVTPKKRLGQHFLSDEQIAKNIVDALEPLEDSIVVEIGPGMGGLTKYLLDRNKGNLYLYEIDPESVTYLHVHYPTLGDYIIGADFLRSDISKDLPENQISLIGNFPYNISSQIFFRVLEHKTQVQEVVCMIQKEVAERIASKHGSKQYGILSVLLQAFYEIEYLFTVHENVFVPPPKVKSGVIRLRRKNTSIDCDEKLMFRVVKQGFNNRRKTLRNALKALPLPEAIRSEAILDKRAEQLAVADFVTLTNMIDHAV